MADLTWTEDRPTRAGFWWYRRTDIPSHAILHAVLEIRMIEGKLKARGYYDEETEWYPLKDYNGQWSSAPIALPKEAK